MQKNNPIIFDGRKFATEKELLLKEDVKILRQKKIIPKLVSILVGDNPASLLYVSLKKKAAERVGARLAIVRLSSSANLEKIVETIEKFNKDNTIHGIMVQLPLPENFTWDERNQILNTISLEKDVDGLSEKSNFVPGTVKAVLEIMKAAKEKVGHDFENVVVVGATGMVGKPLSKLLKKLNYKVIECDISTEDLRSKTVKADLLISATGVSDLIRGEMVRQGAVVIDVGSPKGDVNFKEVSKKAGFITPVPGGVGPVTISSLLENLLQSVSLQLS